MTISRSSHKDQKSYHSSKDFFISYTHADQQWAEWIAWQLEEAGYTTVLQAWDFHAGGNFVLDMDTATKQAKRIIAVLSEDYFTSSFTPSEWAVAFRRDPTGEQGILVPVRVRLCDVEGLLGPIMYIDLIGQGEQAAQATLLARVKRERHKPTKAPAFPSIAHTRSERPTFPNALPRIRNHIKTLESPQDSFSLNQADHSQESHYPFTMHGLQKGGFVEDSAGSSASSESASKATTASTPPLGTRLRIYDTHASYVVAVAWNPHGSRIASAGGDGTVQVWESDTGQLLQTYRSHPWRLAKVNWPPTIYTIAWSPEGLRLASAGDGTNILVWNATTGQTLALYQGHSGLLPNVYAIAWSPDGKYIASACSCTGLDKTIHVWDVTTGAPVKRLNASYGFINFSVLTIAWSPDGLHIAAASGNKTIQIWDAVTGQHISTYQTHSGWVSHLAWSPDSKWIASAHTDCIAQVWDTLTGRSVLMYHGHTDRVRYIAWSPDGTCIATASNDRTVQLWSPRTGNHICTYRGHSHWTTSVTWCPDGTRISSGSNDKTVHIWQAK